MNAYKSSSKPFHPIVFGNKSLFKSEGLCLVGGTQEGKTGDKILQIP